METLAPIIATLLKDDLITANDQQAIRSALQPLQPSMDLLLWVTCRNRRNMTGRAFVLEFCERLNL